MRRILFLSITLLFVFSKTGFSEETVYVIQRGDTIYSIARSYGVKVQDLLALNNINDPRTIRVGSRIRIPSTGTASPSPAYGEYRVEKNDTLYGIARRYNIKVEDLLDMNRFSPDYVLKAGETIRIPASGGRASETIASGSPSGGRGTTPASAQGSTGTQARIDSRIRWPVSAKEITYITGKLYGVQVTGERQEPVKSLTQGTVVSAGPYRGFGRVAIIQSPGGYLYVYGGCENLSVKEGDKVTPGAELGKLGIDAKSSKPQLFFFVYRSNKPVDPAVAPRA
ncbi:MAG: M23 family metallopeptidase [Spirochaetaceae bacterium]|jgi:murein DD-endopeptidase MepM/ murein hydrolase activator NlpD|nr:M23 family metallopeptidase [Spirochaetaceae bacterium]